MAESFQACFFSETKIYPPLISTRPQNSTTEATRNNGILLQKLFWPTVRKIYSSDREFFLKFEAEGQEFAKISNSEKSEQF